MVTAAAAIAMAFLTMMATSAKRIFEKKDHVLFRALKTAIIAWAFKQLVTG